MPIRSHVSHTASRARAWRLTCLTLAFATLGAPAVNTAHAQGRETLVALGAYRLTMPTLRKVLVALRENSRGPDSAVVDAYFWPDPMSRRSIAEVAAFLQRHPSTRRAVARSGLSSREFATAYLSYVHAARYLMEEAAKRMQGQAARPPGHVPRQNVELIRANADELERLLQGR